jgi:hypothetical protein
MVGCPVGGHLTRATNTIDAVDSMGRPKRPERWLHMSAIDLDGPIVGGGRRWGALMTCGP